MKGRALLLSPDCSTLPLIRALYCRVLSKAVASTIFRIFSVTRPGIEPRPPGPLANTLPIRPMRCPNYGLNNTITVFRAITFNFGLISLRKAWTRIFPNCGLSISTNVFRAITFNFGLISSRKAWTCISPNYRLNNTITVLRAIMFNFGLIPLRKAWTCISPNYWLSISTSVLRAITFNFGIIPLRKAWTLCPPAMV